VPDPPKLAKAEFRELDAEFKEEINAERRLTVQFNPETLKVSFANQIAQPPAGAGGDAGGRRGGRRAAADQRGTPTQQFVGAGTTKLALQLWFDVTAPQPGAQEKDVRKLTQKVAYFITPRAFEGAPPGQSLPPAVRFIWGSFQFDGLMESLEESLEYFSDDGRPLRASVSVSLSQQKIKEFAFAALRNGPGSAVPGGAPALPGSRPLAQAPAGATVQGLADDAGIADWQSVAAANGIENPRRLEPGQFVDLQAGGR
jgi:Contractile injection system tube protein